MAEREAEKITLNQVLDAFGELRRTWDELIALQPDIIAAGGGLGETDLELLDERLSAHQDTAQTLAEEINKARLAQA